LLLGWQVDYGWGQSLAVDPYVAPNAWSVINMQSYSLMFVLAGATDMRAIMHVVERITTGENADKSADAKPPPAKPGPAAPP
jgi:hypothetical protein